MAAPDQLYRISEVLGPAVDALVAARPRAKKHIWGGRYGDVLHGWAAQAALVRARLAREIIATRLGLADGQALAELASSEFFAELEPEPQKAIGEVVLRRQVSNGNPGTTGNFGAGVIPAGKRFRLSGDPGAVPPTTDALYESTSAVVCDRDDTADVIVNGPVYTHTQAVSVPIRALRAGPDANVRNVLTLMGSQQIRIVDALFASFTALSLIAAGGSNGVVSDQIRALARALCVGQFGPTSDAGIAGALSHPSVRRAVWVTDPSDAVAKLYIADESWATSAALKRETLSRLYASWLGFGARVAIRDFYNQTIRVRATVTLRNATYLADVEDLSERITKAVTAYFDERPDFYTWNTSTLEGAIVASDAKRRILSGSSIVVEDQGGTALTPPAPTPEPASVTHYWLAGSAVELTFATPT